MEKKLGFIGAGNMAKAMMGGILKNEILLPEDVIASDLYQPGLERTKEELGIAVTTDNQEVVKKAEVVVLSVKPQFYAAVIEEIREVVSEGQIIVTIGAGTDAGTFAGIIRKTGEDCSHNAKHTGACGRRHYRCLQK